MTLEVFNIKGEPTGRSLELPSEVFGIEPNDHVMYLVVKQYLANQRQGTHKAKERGEIKGSTRKIKKQKGTGTARAGSIKNPLFRGGGRVFGPRPRNYSFKLNKKIKRLSRRSALSVKALEGSIRIVEDFTLEKPQTRAIVNILSDLKSGSKKTLLVTTEYDETLRLSTRNLKKTGVVKFSDLHTYDILHCNDVLISESAIEKIGTQF